MACVVVQGMGYVGAAMATAVSSRSDINGQFHSVIGIDLPKEKERVLNKINNGEFPYNNCDTRLKDELSKSIKRGNLFATDSVEFYQKADVVIVSINCDLEIIGSKERIRIPEFIDSLEPIAKRIEENTLVIIESTVPPGTCAKYVYPLFKSVLSKRKLQLDKFYLAHSYERVMPGAGYYESIVNYWRVYSGINQSSANKCENFLSQIVNVEDFPLTRLSSTTASETAKLLENSYRAVNIAFIEEWARFAEDVGIDLYEVIEAIKQRPTHSNIRKPGFGVGGYCLTKDPIFAKISARDNFNLRNHDFSFSSLAVQINSRMPYVTLQKIKKYFNGSLAKKRILLMGVTYKEEIGDTRYSPSQIFYEQARIAGAEIFAYDPMVYYWEEIGINVNKMPNIGNFDAVVFAVRHSTFQDIDFKQLITSRNILFLDANNVLNKVQIKEIKKINNFDYLSIGRG